MTPRRSGRARRRVGYAFALFLLAPWTGEFVLGNQPITALPDLLVLAPLYGGGAVLIREIGRRTRRGWPVMGLLAVAYALLEEGLVDQMVFNPAYLGLAGFADQAAVPGLGISARLTLDSVALHATGSTCVPIVLVEAFDREGPRPWLGRRGLTVVAAVFVVGSTGLAVLQAVDLRFVGAPEQWAATVAVIAGLLVLAVRTSRRAGPRAGEVPETARRARPPAVVLVTAFTCTTGFWLLDLFLAPAAGAWLSVAGGALLLVLGVVVLARGSRRRGWGSAHRLAAAAGALLTYLWLAPVNTAQLGVSPGVGTTGNVVFGLGAVVLLLAARRADRRRARDPRDRRVLVTAGEDGGRPPG